MFPGERHQRPRVRAGAAGVLASGPAAARSWLVAERRSLVGAVGFAATEGWPVRAVQLAGTISRYLDAAAARCLRQALRLCRRTGSRPAEGYALACLGDVYSRTGDIGQARRLWQRARAGYETIGGAEPGQVLAWLGSERTTTPSSRSPGM